MAIYLRRCTFIHVPKTGGTWVGSVLTELGLVVSGKSSQHDSPILTTPGFTFVRHPEDWIISWWCHRKRNNWNWNKDRRIENACKSEDFHAWIANIIQHPGIVKMSLEDFIGQYDEDELEIGKTESISADLIRILSKFGESFDPRIVSGKPKIHVSENRPSIPQVLLADLRESQADYYKKYGYSPIVLN